MVSGKQEALLREYIPSLCSLCLLLLCTSLCFPEPLGVLKGFLEMSSVYQLASSTRQETLVCRLRLQRRHRSHRIPVHKRVNGSSFELPARLSAKAMYRLTIVIHGYIQLGQLWLKCNHVKLQHSLSLSCMCVYFARVCIYTQPSSYFSSLVSERDILQPGIPTRIFDSTPRH